MSNSYNSRYFVFLSTFLFWGLFAEKDAELDIVIVFGIVVKNLKIEKELFFIANSVRKRPKLPFTRFTY